VTGNGLIIALAPWVIFAAALVIILLQLRWPSRPLGRPAHKRADPSQRHQPCPEAGGGKPAASSGEAAGPSQQDQAQSGEDTSEIFKHERKVA
jgi:hypothetical protein